MPTLLTTSVAVAIVVTADAQYATTMILAVTHSVAGPFAIPPSMLVESLFYCIRWQTFLGACSV